MARSKAPSLRGSTIAARCWTLGVMSAPCKSDDMSRSARPVAIAYRSTLPQVLRSLRADSWRPLTSTVRRTVSSSGAEISRTGRLPISG